MASELSAHLRQDQICPLIHGEVLDGVDKEQEKKLRSRKKSTLSEEEKWREMFRVIFPDHDEDLMPSPCIYSSSH
jgi:hypothetical protein